MMTNVIDTEKLGSYIVELKNLHTEWAAKNIVMPDVGECGGSTIIQIEEMGNAGGICFIVGKYDFLHGTEKKLG